MSSGMLKTNISPKISIHQNFATPTLLYLEPETQKLKNSKIIHYYVLLFLPFYKTFSDCLTTANISEL